MTVSLWFLAKACGAALVVFGCGYLKGCRTGVRETEERWSEAVGRAREADLIREIRYAVEHLGPTWAVQMIKRLLTEHGA